MQRERNAILALLLLLALSAWAILLWASRTDEVASASMFIFGVFLATWIVMMVAMMFPTAAPMILTFARVQGDRSQRTLVATAIFVGTYLFLWVAFGALAFALAMAGDALARSVPLLTDNAGRIGGVAIVLAGMYQLSPLKRSCLARCRGPMDFVLGSWRDGLAGAIRMGLEHGVYCLGCCWLLFVALFPLGMTNVGAMALITLLIFAEKSLPMGPRLRVAAAVVLIAYGSVAIFIPDVLPTMPSISAM